MKNNKGKLITCSLCGQVGLPLVNKGNNRDKNYVCKDPNICERRQNIAKVVGLSCSHWYCTTPAKVKCSCGLVLCSFHKNLAEHFGHTKEKLV